MSKSSTQIGTEVGPPVRFCLKKATSLSRSMSKQCSIGGVMCLTDK